MKNYKHQRGLKMKIFCYMCQKEQESYTPCVGHYACKICKNIMSVDLKKCKKYKIKPFKDSQLILR